MYIPPPAEILPEKLSDSSLERRRVRAEKRSGQFIYGPIYLEPMRIASNLPGKALAVWLLILFWSGVERTSQDIPIRPGTIERFGISRQSSYRALAALERAGLISVDRQRGRAALVTIRDAGKDSQ